MSDVAPFNCFLLPQSGDYSFIPLLTCLPKVASIRLCRSSFFIINLLCHFCSKGFFFTFVPIFFVHKQGNEQRKSLKKLKHSLRSFLTSFSSFHQQFALTGDVFLATISLNFFFKPLCFQLPETTHSFPPNILLCSEPKIYSSSTQRTAIFVCCKAQKIKKNVGVKESRLLEIGFCYVYTKTRI